MKKRRVLTLLLVASLAACSGSGRSVPSQQRSAAPTVSASRLPVPPPPPSAVVPRRPPDSTPPSPLTVRRGTSTAHPAFFAGEVPLSNGVYYLAFPNGTPFGYYSYLPDPHYIYHFDLGYEYVFDASDGQGGVYLYDFASGHWWYTSRGFAFPYVYDFTLTATLYYYPDAQNAGRYSANPRYFYNFATGQIIQLPAPPGTALAVRGLWAQFERRGWASEFWSGQVLQNFTSFDSVLNSTVQAEVSLQLDKMRALGVNTILFSLRTADDGSKGTSEQPPTCYMPGVLGMNWPQPTATETTNLTALFDLVNSKNMKVILDLPNTHMEEQPPTNSTTWLGAVLGAVKNHPALALVLFDGDVHVNTFGGTQSCGIPAEPPLWLGPNAAPARYVKWALQYANSLGIPYSRLSAEAIVGAYGVDNDPNLTSPIVVLKGIFDSLNVPDAQRTYAISFYEHRKCWNVAAWIPCTDATPDAWADQTLQGVFATVGRTGAHVIATEMGNNTPVDPAWSTPNALDSLLRVLKKNGADGGSFWRWTSFSDSEDHDTTLADPIKRRGVPFTYNPVESVLVQYYTAP